MIWRPSFPVPPGVCGRSREVWRAPCGFFFVRFPGLSGRPVRFRVPFGAETPTGPTYEERQKFLMTFFPIVFLAMTPKARN